MKKRITCVLLTLIMLMSLLPVSVSAAGMGVSESAITILKQLEGYSTTCNASGYTGYGTECPEEGPHGSHKTNEKLADKALRAKLEELATAVSSFASRKGIALTQNKHDALVLFSFENGTAWTTGTGDLQAAVASGKTGREFLDAICRWDASTDDDNRRMIEANIYLNGVYSSSRPSSFIRVYYFGDGNVYELPIDGEKEYYFGYLPSKASLDFYYYDLGTNKTPHVKPTMDYHTFTGWYAYDEYGWSKVSNLSAAHHDDTLVAGWVMNYSEPGDTKVDYNITASQLRSILVYTYNSAKRTFTAVSGKNVTNYYFMENTVRVDSDYLDEAGNRWCRIAGTNYWIMVTCDGAVSSGSPVFIDVTVTVTNSYVRRRVNASITSAQNGTYNQGDTLRIINTEDADGYLWGQVAASETDDTPVGWVALMYTNFESVRNGSCAAVNNSNAIATAVITYNGYVNVRSDAGTNNRIVSALPKGTEVNIFETKFVNGLEWGRCSTGWFCLSYANVTRLKDSTSHTSDVGFSAYVFTGSVDPNTIEIYKAPSTSADRIFTKQAIGTSVTVSNLVAAEGMTWGKISEGWIRVTDNTTYQPVDVNLHTAKFMVASDALTVRNAPNTASTRVDSLVKDVEFNVNEKNQIIVVGDTIWGYATKVGENKDNNTYEGWVNLANKNVTRNGAPTIKDDKAPTVTGQMATVTGADNLRVRTTGATYGNVIGSLSRGTTVAVWEANEDKSWYKVDSNQNGTYDYEGDGWVSATYLNIFEGTTSGSSINGSTSTNGSGTTETGMGVVANTYSGVNVRQGAGTGYAAVGKLLPGTAVEILEVTTKGASKWGRTAQGWVCMDYITMISTYEILNGMATGTGSAAGNTTTSSEPAIYTGTVKNAVTIYKETNTASDAVRTLAAGDPITLHEILTVTVIENEVTSDDNTGTTTTTKTTYWARVNDGYIEAPGNNINLDTVDEHVYTVTETEKLNVRNDAGTVGTTVIFALVKGEQVTVTELKIVNGNVWGKVECEDEDGQLITGWASLAYMTKGAIVISSGNTTNNNVNTGVNSGTGTGTVTPPVMGNGSSTGGFVTNTSGYRYTGKVINTNALNVRATPSQTATKTTTLSSGQALVIYETTTADNMAWGRCDAGWVYLYYVDLTPVTGAVDARVVYNDNTVIYTDMNCSAVAGTYARMSVIDIFEIVGKMARTELGWVNTDNLL